jgi:enoyl-CoA hydratase
MVEDDIRREDADGIITITLTRDRKLNAMSDEMIDVVRTAVDDLADHVELRAMVINAEGRYFTAGKDIGQLGEQAPSGVMLRRNYRRLHDVFDEMEMIEKPVILAAQGPCLGIGVEMASSCDFRFATERAHFGLPEIPNLAVIPGSGGISRFTRMVGPAWARWVAMAGENITAQHALTIGFVQHIFPEEGFHAAVHEWTKKLIVSSAEALGLAKLAIDAAVDSDRRTARHFDRLANTDLMHSREHIEMIAKFNERSKNKK